MTGILARFPENIGISVSNSLLVGNIGFILLFLESVLWLIIIYFTLYIIQIVRKIPLQYVSYIDINKVNRYVPLKITSSLMMPIIFSETIILLTNSFIPHFSNENFKTFYEDKYGIWYNCIYTFFYRYMALSIRKIGYDLKRYDAYIHYN